MQLQKYILNAGTASAAFVSLVGCAQQASVAPPAIPPNPFGYDKVSSLCEVDPLEIAPDGTMSVNMAVGSGEGGCSLSISKGGGGSYASFGLLQDPEHGKAFLYNYNGRTYVRYIPTTAYKGDDQFKAELISARKEPRPQLTVKVAVKAAGIDSPRKENGKDVSLSNISKEKIPSKKVSNSASHTLSKEHIVQKEQKDQKVEPSFFERVMSIFSF